MFIIESIILFSILSLSLNRLKIEIPLLYKKVKYLKNDDFNKILKEWESIDKQTNFIVDETYANSILNEHYDIVINTKIMKRYREYFELDQIPKNVYSYTAKKVKQKLKQKVGGEKIFENFQNQYYGRSSGGIGRQQVNISKYYSILGIEQSDDLKTIKKVYRNKMKQYHPDKLNNMSESDKNYGEEQSKKINEAYTYLSKIKK